MNKNGPIRRDTRAWLLISPTVGILHHPSVTGEVDAFISAIRAAREADEPDLRKRCRETVMGALKNTWVDTARPGVMLELASAFGEEAPIGPEVS